MINIKVDTSGLKALQAQLAGQQKQVRFATAQALTRTAYAIAGEVTRALPSELDRPKPATARAIIITRATRDNLTATVRFKARGEGVPAAEYLAHNILGGKRPLKRSEIMLRTAGLLPAGRVSIPGSAAKLDTYGNMSRGQIVSILSFFRTFGNTNLNSGRMNRSTVRKTRASADYFAVPPGQRLPSGIYQRKSGKALPVLMFVTPGDHRKLIKLQQTADRIVKRDFDRQFDAALQNALATAR